ncbi:hypothetical protein LZ32DRAFT_278277 [Colletotrichum eremochloae]|nr:hypothetical protein LZ32DRAFT_278277 [Colletotrichum eremochloae]
MCVRITHPARGHRPALYIFMLLVNDQLVGLDVELPEPTRIVRNSPWAVDWDMHERRLLLLWWWWWWSLLHHSVLLSRRGLYCASSCILAVSPRR